MSYASEQPELAVIESIAGLTVLEFGTNWCGFCLRAQGDIAKGLSESKRLNHIKVEDGPGRPLGRSFRVKLWPTLIFLHEGVEVTRWRSSRAPTTCREGAQGEHMGLPEKQNAR
jgi:thioredoxin 1